MDQPDLDHASEQFVGLAYVFLPFGVAFAAP